MSSSPVETPTTRDSATPYEVTPTAKPRLKDYYDSYFQIVVARTEEQRREAFRLRYQVYCIEYPYESADKNAGGMERDAWDDVSLHALLYHRRSGGLVGACRLILPEKDGRPVALPLRDVCQHEYVALDHKELPRRKTGEVSRFAVSKDFRRRADEDTIVGAFTMPGDDPRRIIPNTSLGLMQAILTMAAEARITHLAAVMEPFLLRMLARLGIHFHKLGPLVDYHGLRQPCYSGLDDLLGRLWLEKRDVWELITDDGKLWTPKAEIVAQQQQRAATAA